VEYIPHVVCDMAKPRHTANHAISRPQNTIKYVVTNGRSIFIIYAKLVCNNIVLLQRIQNIEMD